MTAKESGKQAPDMSFKKFFLDALHEEIEAAKEGLWQLIDKHEVFSKGEYDMSCTDLVMHCIDTRDRVEKNGHLY